MRYDVVTASDLPVNREVYGEVADYFNPYDTGSLVTGLWGVIGDAGAGAARERLRWADTVEKLEVQNCPSIEGQFDLKNARESRILRWFQTKSASDFAYSAVMESITGQDGVFQQNRPATERTLPARAHPAAMGLFP